MLQTAKNLSKDVISSKGSVMSSKDVEVMGQIVDAVTSLSEQYEIPYEEAVEHAEFALSYALSERLGLDVHVYLRDRCRILVFDDTQAKEVKTGQIKKKAIRHAKKFLQYRFLCLHAYRVYREAVHLVRTVVSGQILRIIKQTLYVKILNPHAAIEGGRVLIGVCSPEHQTPKERGTYWKGEILAFFVASVRGIVEEKVPRVIITLSRNSISLPEVMLKNFLFDIGITTKVKAVKRIAGAYTIIHTEQKIPKEIIQRVFRELNEGIIVKYRSVKEGKPWL